MVDARVISPSVLLLFRLFLFHWLCFSFFASTSRLNSFLSFAEAGGGKYVLTLTMGHYK